MNLREIAEAWLQENGFDGLCKDDCGCDLSDLVACGEPDSNCKPGYKVPCPGPSLCEVGGDCDFHISTIKPEPKAPEKTEKGGD